MNTVPVSSWSPRRSARSGSCVQSDTVSPYGLSFISAERLLVAGHLHDADDRAEALLAHHLHVVGHAGQHLRREVGAAVVRGKGLDMGRGPRRDRLGDLRAHHVGEALRGHRAEGRGAVERIAELVALAKATAFSTKAS